MFPSAKNLHGARKQSEAQIVFVVLFRDLGHNRNYRRLRVPGESLPSPMGS